MQYASTFIAGADKLISKNLSRDLKDVSVNQVLDGLIIYESERPTADIMNLKYFSNTFIILAKFREKAMTFEKAAEAVCSINYLKNSYKNGIKTFRIMFSDENTFVNVKPFYRNKAELNITRRTGLKLNGLTPDTEFWFLKRSEGMLLFLQRLTTGAGRKQIPAKYRQKGRLSPQLAHIMCSLASVERGDLVCDPFVGYGAIPDALLSDFSPKSVFCSDISQEKTAALTKRWKNNKKLTIANNSVETLDKVLKGMKYDKIITDPPWGLFDKEIDVEGLFGKALTIFSKILKDNGCVVLLADRNIEMKKILSAEKIPLYISQRHDILVNGKKASLYKLLIKTL